jgi:hypothetical protein
MSHIRLEYLPTATSRTWRQSSLTMWAQGRDNMVRDCQSPAKARGLA